MIPSPYVLILLAIATYRVWRLIAEDEITHGIRRRLLGIHDQAYGQWAYVLNNLEAIDDNPWAWQASVDAMRDRYSIHLVDATGSDQVPPMVWGPPPVGHARWYVAKLVHCPWCLGFWIALAFGCAWEVWPDATSVIAAFAAISTAPGIIHTVHGALVDD